MTDKTTVRQLVDKVDDQPSCPDCGDLLLELGSLGDMIHYRCPGCRIDVYGIEVAGRVRYHAVYK